MMPLYKFAEVDWSNIAGKWTPAVYGGAAGLGLGALSATSKPNETKGQRALRVLRNALLGGALGAGGAQAISHGVGQIGEVVQDPDGKGPTPPTKVGPMGYAASLGGMNLLGRLRAGAARRSELGTLTSPNGFGDPGQFGRLRGQGRSEWNLGTMRDGVSRGDYLRAVDDRIKGIARGGANEWDAFRRAFGAQFGQGNPAATDSWLQTAYGPGARSALARNIAPVASQIIPNAGAGGMNRRLQAGLIGGGLKLPLALGLPHALAWGADAVTGTGNGAIGDYMTEPVRSN